MADIRGVFGRRLRAARKRARMTQAQLGAAAGLDPLTAGSRVNRYEKGTHMPDFQIAQRLAEAAGVPVAYLYCDDDRLANLIAAWPKVDSPGQERLLKQAEILSAEQI